MVEAPVTTNEQPARPGVLAQRLTGSEAGRWFLIALVGFLVGQLASLAAVSLVAALKGESAALSTYATASSPPQWYVLASLIGLWVGFLGAPLVAVRLGPIRRHLGVSIRRIDLLGIPLGMAGQFIVVLLYAPFISHLHNFDAPVKKLTGGSHGGGLWLIALATVVVAPIAEEVFFRGLLFRSLLNFADGRRTARARSIGVVVAVIADGALFALAHGELAQMAGLALFGMALAVAFLKTGRLGMSIAAHMSFNGIAIASLVASSGVISRWL